MRRRWIVVAVGAWGISGVWGCTRPAPGLDPPAALDAPTPTPYWSAWPSLPHGASNNAVAAAERDGVLHLFSFLGLGAGKTRTDIRQAAFVLVESAPRWTPIPDVPGTVGRLAATAQSVGDRVYLIGGYTVAPNGREVSVTDVDVYDLARGKWSKAAPMPVPVDDAVSGRWRNKIVLVSGWSQKDNVADVQWFDPTTNSWSAATPIAGPPVFGHAGAVVGDLIVYCDGVAVHPAATPKFRMAPGCWQGAIDTAKPSKIDWRPLPEHPGAAKYRMAAGPVVSRQWVVFTGGTENPYNYDGVGYDGIPSEPSAQTFAWDAKAKGWVVLPQSPTPTMDHRGLVPHRGRLLRIGGMTVDQQVTAAVEALELATD